MSADPALAGVSKPNPYVIVEKRDDNPTDKSEVRFKYPKSKIFVGGLDFKLTNEDLQQHFQQYGEIESAVILKDINTGQSRGFGFVTFKEEAVAQRLILDVGTTNICGRKVDIKSAEPKQSNSNQPAPVIPKRVPYGERSLGQPPNSGGNQYAMIPQYGGKSGALQQILGENYEQ